MRRAHHPVYPDEWRDYSGLQLNPADLYGNVERSAAFDWAYQVAMLGKSVNPKAWGPFYWRIHPQTVDAINIASENKIIFPAALLQPPQFDPAADPAVNYGMIGAIIGHEISHAFDDQGRKFDASGAIRDWWASKDAAHNRRQKSWRGKWCSLSSVCFTEERMYHGMAAHGRSAPLLALLASPDRAVLALPSSVIRRGDWHGPTHGAQSYRRLGQSTEAARCKA